MIEDENWVDVGHVDEFVTTPLKRVTAVNRDLAVSLKDGQFGAVSNACNHVGGSLGEGRLDGDYIVCPWHNWKFHRCSGVGEPGFEEDRVPAYPVKVDTGRVFVNLVAGSTRHKTPHEPHPLSRKVERAPGSLRLAGISTTVMDAANLRFSGSDHLLDHALKAAQVLGAETRLIKLNNLTFRNCEGYYSKAAQACTWPCSITQMDSKDQMEQIYEVLSHRAEVSVARFATAVSLASTLTTDLPRPEPLPAGAFHCAAVR